MIWRGLDKRSGSEAVPGGTSPDTVNTDHFEGMIGQLGPRPGVTFFNTTAYDAAMQGFGLFTFGGGRSRRYLTFLNDGTVKDIAAPLATQNYPSYPSASGDGIKDLSSAISLTLTLPSTSTSTSSAFSDGSTYTCAAGSAWLVQRPTITFTVGGPNTFRVTAQVTVGLANSGGSLLNSGTTFDYTIPLVAGATSAILTDVPSSSAYLVGRAGGSGGTVAGIYVGITVGDWGSSASGSVVVGGISRAILFSDA